MGPHVLEVERIQNTSSYGYFSLVGTSPIGHTSPYGFQIVLDELQCRL